jgi:hypothetical protein
MPDYSLGKIYMVYPKVEDPDEGDVYYGSTTVTLARRMSNHRGQSQCKILFDKYGVENCFIELVEKYPCETKEQLNRKEGEYIRNHKCINKKIAGRTQKEYYVEHYDKITEQIKHYRTENVDKVKETHKKYYDKHREKIIEKQKEYVNKHKDNILEYQKKYRIENKDKRLERNKQYYDKNVDKILEKHKQKVNCPICNKELTKCCISRHIKTQHK